MQVPLPDFSHYTYPHFRERGNTSHPPIVWFVSHCNAHSGRFKHKTGNIETSRGCDNDNRDKYITWLRKWIGVDIYGKCGEKQCGEVRNMQHEYTTATDPCFDLVNRKYR